MKSALGGDSGFVNALAERAEPLLVAFVARVSNDTFAG